jgi:hypothetical protein
LLLILIPWSAFWERNYFAQVVPGLEDVISNAFVRGAVSGLGFLNLIAALGELADLLGAWRGRARTVGDDADGLGDRHAS